MISSGVTSTDRESELNIFALWRVVWDSRYFILITAFACAVIAAVLALAATPIFRAEVVAMDVRESNTSGLSSIAGQFGGLASLAGMNLSAGTGPAREARAVLESRYLAEEFIKRYKLERTLLPKAKEPPTLWRAVERFRDGVLKLSEDKVKGTLKVGIEWTDPAVAAQWANQYVALANEIVRTRALDDSTRNIAYLNGQIAKTTVVEVQRVMYSLIENEMKTLMLANARAEYALTVVDPAKPPEQRVRPRRTLTVLVGTILGLFLGAAIALFRDSLARYQRSAALAR